MIICPRCSFDGQIIRNVVVEKEGKRFRVLTYACRNRHCPMYKKEIGKEEIEIKEGENNESKSES